MTIATALSMKAGLYIQKQAVSIDGVLLELPSVPWGIYMWLLR